MSSKKIPKIAVNSEWEQYLCWYHGIENEQFTMRHTTSLPIRFDSAVSPQQVHADEPRNACNYLLLQEQKCLQEAFRREVASYDTPGHCLKWFSEWAQCQWDQEKLTRGYNFIEPFKPKKSRPFYSSPNFRYS